MPVMIGGQQLLRSSALRAAFDDLVSPCCMHSPEEAPPEVEKLIDECLSAEPTARPSAAGCAMRLGAMQQPQRGQRFSTDTACDSGRVPTNGSAAGAAPAAASPAASAKTGGVVIHPDAAGHEGRIGGMAGVAASIAAGWPPSAPPAAAGLGQGRHSQTAAAQPAFLRPSDGDTAAALPPRSPSAQPAALLGELPNPFAAAAVATAVPSGSSRVSSICSHDMPMPWSAPLLAALGMSPVMSPVTAPAQDMAGATGGTEAGAAGLSEQLRQMSETVAPSTGSWEEGLAVPLQGGPEAQQLHLAGGSDEAALLYGTFADD